METLKDETRTTPCVGCGYCCKTAPCGVALRIYGNITQCPSLKWDAEKQRHICGIIADPVIGFKFAEELAIGAGCCSPLCNTWRQDVHNRIEPEPLAYQLGAEAQAIISAFARDWITGDQLWLALHAAGKDLKNPLFLPAALRLVNEQRSSMAKSFMG